MNNNTKSTILIVDDCLINLKLLSNLLDNTYNVKVTNNSLKTLELLNNDPIDLLLLDIEMPEVNGFEIFKRLKQDESTKDIPVIFVSGHTDMQTQEKAFKIGVDDFIFKPINITILKAKISTHISLRLKKFQLNSSQKILEEYKEVVDESSIFSIGDKRGNITYVNSHFCKISGYTQEELLGKPHSIIRHPDMPKEIYKTLWHTIKTLKLAWRGKIKNLRKDGTYYWVDATIKPILDTNGNIIEFIGLRHDITELEDNKEFLNTQLQAASHSFLEYEEAIINNSAIVKLSKELKIKFANDKYLELTEYSFDEIFEKSIFDFIDDESFQDKKEFINFIQSKRLYQGTFKGNSKSGKKYFTKTTIKQITNSKGEILEYLLIKNDITQIINSHLEIIATQKEIVYKMGEIAESRSQETGNHVKRVAKYSKLLAQLSGLGEEEAEILFIASPMHDIGKVGIPDRVLNKPGKLDDEEWKIMQTHSSIGYKILKGSKKDVLKAAAIVAYEHHEKWDGTGYPRKLKGEDIHIYGRITAIADVFDALGSDRCYKKAWELDQILKLFQEEKGKHFDPTLVELFFENLNKFLEIRERFKDVY